MKGRDSNFKNFRIGIIERETDAPNAVVLFWHERRATRTRMSKLETEFLKDDREMDEQRGFSAWGIKTGPFAPC